MFCNITFLLFCSLSSITNWSCVCLMLICLLWFFNHASMITFSYSYTHSSFHTNEKHKSSKKNHHLTKYFFSCVFSTIPKALTVFRKKLFSCECKKDFLFVYLLILLARLVAAFCCTKKKGKMLSNGFLIQFL